MRVQKRVLKSEKPFAINTTFTAMYKALKLKSLLYSSENNVFKKYAAAASGEGVNKHVIR